MQLKFPIQVGRPTQGFEETGKSRDIPEKGDRILVDFPTVII
jgi:hypothetical protein